MSSTPHNILLMVRELNIGGTERQCAAMAIALDRSRFLPHVACFHNHGYRADELRNHNVPVLHLPVTSFASPSALGGAILLCRYIRRHRIRLVHTFDSPMNLYGAPIARACGVPVVLTSQRQSRSLYPSLIRWLRLTDRIADGIVVNSEAVLREMLHQDRVPPAKLHLCQNGIDTSSFVPRDFSRPDSGTLTIGVLCALRPEKGLLTLIDAFHQVHTLHPGLRLVIVGSGVMREPLEQRIRALGLQSQCHLKGPTSDVPGWLHRMDIFVLPSLSEALSNSLMEAMACGCAAVASDTGGNPELIEPERTGLLFPPGDAAALASCLRRLLLDPALRRSLARTAANVLHSRFSLDAAAGRLAALYESCLARRIRPNPRVE